MSEHLFTSESVTEGHPDKICDQIADAILDDILENDVQARVACEVCANTGLVLIFGEITTVHYCNMAGLARAKLREVGYDDCPGFSADACAVLVSIDEQSPDIAQGVNVSEETRDDPAADPLDALGAGDQGLMFGFACTESERVNEGTYMPLPIYLAHTLARQLALVRRDGELRKNDDLRQLGDMLRPDGKTQVSLRYSGLEPQAVETVLISTQHEPDVERKALKEQVFELVVQPVVPPELCPGGEHGWLKFFFNPTGAFVSGGPEADSGLSGRKIIVDTYGGAARHGGGSFSGKDPTKVDRSATYYARYVAKNLVAAGVAQRLELQVSYAIGRAHPTSLAVETFGTGKVDEPRIEQLLRDGGLFDFRPGAIIEQLELLSTRYAPVAAYGHFGRTDIDLPWERLDKVDAVRQALVV